MAKKKNNDRVREWEEGLPSLAELTPLSQCLISPELACAFSITSEQASSRTLADVNRASQSTFATLRRTSVISLPSFGAAEKEHGSGVAGTDDGKGGGGGGSREGRTFEGSNRPGQSGADSPYPQPFQALGVGFSPPAGLLGSYGHDAKGNFSAAVLNGLSPYSYEKKPDDGPSPAAAAAGATGLGGTDSSDGAARNSRIEMDGEPEEAESGPAQENSNERTLKRPRLVWTPELHKRFVEAVAHLGIKNAVPKTIMQLMNVEGLTRENVASHLQKYRLYLKRMLSNEGPSASDQLFASTPLPPGLAASTRFLTGISGHMDEVMTMPFTPPLVPVPIGRAHMAGNMNAVGPFAALDPHTYNAFARAPPQRFVSGDQKDLIGNSQSQPASPSHHILTLFPAGGR